MSRSTQQAALFPEQQFGPIVNVASVPHRSPFRYPGGKTWLVPHIRRWLAARPKPVEFFEPFAGGGIISLTVVAEDLVNHATMIELDEQVAAVWQVLIEGDAGWLANRIVNFALTTESLRAALARKARTQKEFAFQTILKNRTYRGGILARGSAPLKHGENGKGIASRWYPATLARRIRDIAAMRERLSFICDDGLEVIRRNSQRGDAVFFVDPPYTAAGKKAGSRLYNYSTLNHEELFSLMNDVGSDFLMTYDDTDEVRELVRRYQFDVEVAAMKNAHHTKMTELLIGRDLNWARTVSP